MLQMHLERPAVEDGYDFSVDNHSLCHSQNLMASPAFEQSHPCPAPGGAARIIRLPTMVLWWGALCPLPVGEQKVTSQPKCPPLCTEVVGLCSWRSSWPVAFPALVPCMVSQPEFEAVLGSATSWSWHLVSWGFLRSWRATERLADSQKQFIAHCYHIMMEAESIPSKPCHHLPGSEIEDIQPLLQSLGVLLHPPWDTRRLTETCPAIHTQKCPTGPHHIEAVATAMPCPRQERKSTQPDRSGSSTCVHRWHFGFLVTKSLPWR